MVNQDILLGLPECKHSSLLETYNMEEPTSMEDNHWDMYIALPKIDEHDAYALPKYNVMLSTP